MLADRQQQQTGDVRAEHLGGPADPTGFLAQVTAERGSGGDATRCERTEQIRVGDDQCGESGCDDRTRYQLPCGFLHHGAQVGHRPVGAAVLLGDGDPEQSQIGSTVEDGPPGIGPPILDAANSFTGPGARSPAADEFTGSGLVVGDGDGHIDSLGLGHGAANGHGRAL